MASKRQLNRAYGDFMQSLRLRDEELRNKVVSMFMDYTIGGIDDVNIRTDMKCVSGTLDAMQQVRERLGLNERPGYDVSVHASREFVVATFVIINGMVDHLRIGGHFKLAESYSDGLMLLREWHERLYDDSEWTSKLFGFEMPPD